MSEYSELKNRHFPEGVEKMSSVSMINGHIDPDKNRLTDEEIIKVMECCPKDDCEHCPLVEIDGCLTTLFHKGYILDLINRQQAEIEGLQREIETKNGVVLEIFENKSAFERVARVKAIKEFANLLIKRIRENVTPIPQQRYLVKMCIQEIYNLVKEMIGE